jgi:hypothetical protein
MNVYDAKITAKEAVEQNLKVIDSVKPSESGKYLTFEGGVLPWVKYPVGGVIFSPALHIL